MTEIVVDVKNLFKSYTFDRNLAVNNVSFEVFNKEIIGIVGEKGAVVPKEDYVFFTNMTVQDHIKFYSEISFCSNDIYDMLKRLNFKRQLNDKIKDLDRVERNKLKIVFALLKNRKILFLEEPTNGMTEEDKHCFWNEIKLLKNEKTIIFSTESIEEASYCADFILYLKEGKILSMGNKETIVKTLEKKHQLCEIEIEINHQY
ncbi:hypothetical protein PIROE2DRAFT_59619 [Piromyces sp. E2]|nr:hypothetical protein PIROE2DRAFT_59619 [Piromyces sp. E2]|eukprot:OUM66040.1 hypothetical protein PIROE2DRAFT_59619 [Piromyces sp. E2]